MIKVYQTKFGRHGANGDCFPACLASILECKLSEVPDFYEDVPPGETPPPHIIHAQDMWFMDRGLFYWEIAVPNKDLPTLLTLTSRSVFRYPYILIGMGMAGETHAVVCEGAMIVHNPSSISVVDAMQGPCNDGLYRLGVLTKRIEVGLTRS